MFCYVLCINVFGYVFYSPRVLCLPVCSLSLPHPACLAVNEPHLMLVRSVLLNVLLQKSIVVVLHLVCTHCSLCVGVETVL